MNNRVIIQLSASEEKMLDKWFNTAPKDKDDYYKNYLYNGGVFVKSICFGDGYRMKIEYHTGFNEHATDGMPYTSWAEAVLFDCGMKEIARKKQYFHCNLGWWIFQDEYSGISYEVVVVSEKDKVTLLKVDVNGFDTICVDNVAETMSMQAEFIVITERTSASLGTTAFVQMESTMQLRECMAKTTVDVDGNGNIHMRLDEKRDFVKLYGDSETEIMQIYRKLRSDLTKQERKELAEYIHILDEAYEQSSDYHKTADEIIKECVGRFTEPLGNDMLKVLGSID